MNREIKFRAWNAFGNQMLQWSDCCRPQVLTLSNLLNGSIPHIIPMQYTGRKDVNGVGIYEGDIIRHGESIRTIEYGSSNFHAISRDRTGSLLLSFSASPEVIGNIYENPELLNS